MKDQPYLDTSPEVSDEIRKTTCYMCACRCGINVHVKNNKVSYIEGNKDHPVNKGVLCAKGSAGIMQINAPSRLNSPLKRVGPRGSGEFEEITWEEALNLATTWLKPIREKNPEKLAFFTGRDQSQSFTSFWAQNFGTPNYAAHGGFCSVNMAAAGIYTMGGAFWEFGQPDWEHTKLFMLFGVAEDHDSNPIKMGIGKLKARGARIIGINPIRTGYSAVADDWVGITPGTDGLFIMSLIHLLLKAGKIDLAYLSQFTNAPVLVDNDTGLLLKDKNNKELVIDQKSGKLVTYDTKNITPSLTASHNGHQTVFYHMIERNTYQMSSALNQFQSERGSRLGRLGLLRLKLLEWHLKKVSRSLNRGQTLEVKSIKQWLQDQFLFTLCVEYQHIPMDSKLVGLYMSCKLFLERLKFLEAFDLSLLTLSRVRYIQNHTVK